MLKGKLKRAGLITKVTTTTSALHGLRYGFVTPLPAAVKPDLTFLPISATNHRDPSLIRTAFYAAQLQNLGQFMRLHTVRVVKSAAVSANTLRLSDA